MNLGFTAVLIIVFLAIPVYISLFWLNLAKIQLTPGISNFLGREMVVIGFVTSVPSYYIAWKLCRYYCYEISFFTPLRYIVSPPTTIKPLTIPDSKWIEWTWFCATFYAVCFFWSMAWTFLLKKLVVRISLVADFLEALQVWDSFTQLISFDVGTLVDITHEDDGSVVYSGELESYIEGGLMPGVVLRNVSKTYFKEDGSEAGKAYQENPNVQPYNIPRPSTLGRVFFARDKIKNIHIRQGPVPIAVSSSIKGTIYQKLKKINNAPRET